MMEIVLVTGAAFVVFLLFFLVFTIKKREGDEPVRIHNCHNCTCGKKEGDHLERFRAQADAAVDADGRVRQRQMDDAPEKPTDPS